MCAQVSALQSDRRVPDQQHQGCRGSCQASCKGELTSDVDYLSLYHLLSHCSLIFQASEQNLHELCLLPKLSCNFSILIFKSCFYEVILKLN